MEEQQAPTILKKMWAGRHSYDYHWNIKADTVYLVTNFLIFGQLFLVKYGFTDWNSLLFYLHRNKPRRV